MYCPLGLWMAPPAPTAWKSDQLESGLAVLPVRVSNAVPVLVLVRLPHTVWALSADRTREVKVPERGSRHAQPVDRDHIRGRGVEVTDDGRIGPAIDVACVASSAPST